MEARPTPDYDRCVFDPRRAIALCSTVLVAACGTPWPNTPRIGDACGTDGCGPLLQCVQDADFPAGLCTRSCREDDDCFLDGDVRGVCTGNAAAPGICLRACHLDATLPCGRQDGWVCAETRLRAGACLPDCRQGAIACPELTSCGDDGTCRPLDGDGAAFDACGGDTGVRCGAGLTCLYFPGDASGRCHASCDETNPCPAPQQCALTASDGARACTRTCDPGIGDCPTGLTCRRRSGTEVGVCTGGATTGPRTEMQPCSRADDALCTAGLTCLAKDAAEGSGVCVVECATASDCPAARACVVPVTGALRACTVPCNQPGDIACPTGSTCLYGECLPE